MDYFMQVGQIYWPRIIFALAVLVAVYTFALNHGFSIERKYWIKKLTAGIKPEDIPGKGGILFSGKIEVKYNEHKLEIIKLVKGSTVSPGGD